MTMPERNLEIFLTAMGTSSRICFPMNRVEKFVDDKYIEHRSDAVRWMKEVCHLIRLLFIVSNEISIGYSSKLS
jgi:hypothetical protein